MRNTTRIQITAIAALLMTSATGALADLTRGGARPQERSGAQERNGREAVERERNPSETNRERAAREKIDRETRARIVSNAKEQNAALRDAQRLLARVVKSENFNRERFNAAEAQRAAARTKYESYPTLDNLNRAAAAQDAADNARLAFENAKSLLESQRQRVADSEASQRQAVNALMGAFGPWPRNAAAPRFVEARPRNMAEMQPAAGVSAEPPRRLLAQPTSHYADPNAIPQPRSLAENYASFINVAELNRMNDQVARANGYDDIRIVPAAVQSVRSAPQQNGARAPVLNVELLSAAAQQRQAAQQANQGEVRAQGTRIRIGQ